MSNQIDSLKMGQKFKKTPAGEIPVDWEARELGELCVKNPEYGANVSAIEFQEGLPRYVRITDINDDGTLISTGAKSIRKEDAKGYLLGEGEIIFARSGATVGKTYLYRKSDGPCAFAGYTIRFKPNSSYLLPEFLFQFTHSNFYYQWVKGMLRAGAQPNINGAEYSGLILPVPPIKEQDRIVATLSSVDELVSKISEEIEKTKELKNGLMCQFLTRGIGHEKFKKTSIGKIPKSWQVNTIDSIKANIKNAIVDGPFGSNLKTIHYRTSGVPVIQSGFVTSNVFEAKSYVYVDAELFKEQGRSQVLPGDIVMAKIGAQAGTCAILPPSHPVGILAGNSLKITTDPNKCVPEYLVFYLHYRYSQDGLGAIKTITAQPAISLKSLKGYEIPVPDIKEQKEIVAILSELDAGINRKTALFEKTSCLKKGLMNSLLTGKVRV